MKKFFTIVLIGAGFGLGLGLGFADEPTWGAVSFFATAFFCGVLVWKDC